MAPTGFAGLSTTALPTGLWLILTWEGDPARLIERLSEACQVNLPMVQTPSAVDIAEVIDDPLARALFSIGEDSRHVDHEAFARLVVDRIEEGFAIESDAKENLVIQWFNYRDRVWVKAGGGRRLQQRVIDVCREAPL